MGQTRVDLLHLLEDLRDAYPGSIEETIVAETVANALDSGAGRVSFAAQPDDRALVIVDDGEALPLLDAPRKARPQARSAEERRPQAGAPKSSERSSEPPA